MFFCVFYTSDHAPVIVNMKMKLKKIKRIKTEPKAQLRRLKDYYDLRKLYSVSVKNTYELLKNEEDITVENQWTRFSEALVKTADEIIPKKERAMRQEWRLMLQRADCDFMGLPNQPIVKKFRNKIAIAN